MYALHFDGIKLELVSFGKHRVWPSYPMPIILLNKYNVIVPSDIKLGPWGKWGAICPSWQYWSCIKAIPFGSNPIFSQ